jgi:hypothetical protein
MGWNEEEEQNGYLDARLTSPSGEGRLTVAEAVFRIACSLDRSDQTQPKDVGPVPQKRRWLLKGKFGMALALGIGISILPLPLLAHHGNAAYDTGKNITLKGTVTQWIWANPHCVLRLDVTDDHGQVVQWAAETENPSSMIHFGWTKQSLKTGDQVTVTVLPVKTGNPVGRILEVVLPDGQKLVGRALPTEYSKPEDSPKQ